AGDRFDERVDAGHVGDVEHAPRAAVRGQPRADRLRTRVAGRSADDGRAQRGQPVRDRGTDAATRAGDQRDLAGQYLLAHGHSCWTRASGTTGRNTGWLSVDVVHACRADQERSANAASNSSGVPIERTSMDRSMRRTRPDRTLPGPHSTI